MQTAHIHLSSGADNHAQRGNKYDVTGTRSAIHKGIIYTLNINLAVYHVYCVICVEILIDSVARVNSELGKMVKSVISADIPAVNVRHITVGNYIAGIAVSADHSAESGHYEHCKSKK